MIKINSKKKLTTIGCHQVNCSSCCVTTDNSQLQILPFSTLAEIPDLPAELQTVIKGSSGLVITVPPKTVVKDPFIVPSCSLKDETFVLMVGADSEVSLFDTARCGCTAKSTTQRLIIHIGSGAVVRISELRCLANDQKFSGDTYAIIETQGRLELFSGLFSGGELEVKTDIKLNGPKATIERTNLVFGTADSRQYMSEVIHHNSDQTNSFLLSRGVLDNSSKANWNFLTEIVKKASGCVGHQDCRQLLLSSKAQAHIQPALEIGSSDVTCSHSASVSQTDLQSLFYLMARGLPLAVARQQLALGFFRPIFDKIHNQENNETIQQMIKSRLGCKVKSRN